MRRMQFPAVEFERGLRLFVQWCACRVLQGRAMAAANVAWCCWLMIVDRHVVGIAWP
jgi:hypothetical protein